jgi:hypothetical protein
LVNVQERRFGLLRHLVQGRRTARALRTLPLAQADIAAIGHRSDHIQDVLAHTTAHRFRRGHRIRVQVSSGAFPRYARNPGTGEPHATATVLRPADQSVHHDPAHPSAIILPTR